MFLILQDLPVYRKCTVNVIIMSLILEMCRTHEISNTAGNIQEISDITGNVQEMSCFIVMEMYMKCEFSIS